MYYVILTTDGELAVGGAGLGVVTSLARDVDAVAEGIDPATGFDDLVRVGQWLAHEGGTFGAL